MRDCVNRRGTSSSYSGMRSKFSLLIVGVIPAFALGFAPEHTLRFEPVVGWTAVYTQTVTVAGAAEVEAEAKMRRTVVSVDSEGGWIERSINLEAFVRTAAGEARDERPQERTTRFDSFGALREITTGNAEVQSYRQGLLTRFVAPPKAVAIDEVWRYERAAERPTGMPPVQIRYRLLSVLGEPGRRHFVVSFQYTETAGSNPMTATGSFTLNHRFEPTEVTVRAENYLGEPGTTAQIKITRLE